MKLEKKLYDVKSQNTGSGGKYNLDRTPKASNFASPNAKKMVQSKSYVKIHGSNKTPENLYRSHRYSEPGH